MSGEEHFDIYPDPESIALVERFEKMMKEEAHYFFDVDEYEEIIDYYLYINDSRKAKSCIRFALEQHQGNVSLLLKKAQFFVNAGQNDMALNILADLEESESTDSETCLAKGNLYSQLEKPEKAIEEYTKALHDSEDADDIYTNIAFEYENLGKYEKAIGYLVKAIELNPSNEAVLYELSFCYEISKQTEDAIKFLSDYLDKSPYSKAAWFNLGIAYSNLELFEKAIEAYDYAIAIDEVFASAYFNKANCYANLGNFEKAIETYLETSYYEEPEPLTYYYIAECFEKLEKFDRSVDYYKKAIRLDPEFADAWLGTGISYDAQGKSQAALTYVHKAIKIVPTVPDYWFIQGDIQVKLKKIEEGIESYRKVIELEPEDPEVWLELAVVYSDQGDYGKAFDTLTEGMKWHDQNPDFRYGMANYLLKAGKTKQAYEMLESALGMDYEGYRRMFKSFPDLSDNPDINGIIEGYNKGKE